MRIQYFVLWLFGMLYLQACSQQPLTEPRSQYYTVFSQALQKKMPYAVYTPLDWSTQERLPLVILLHGGFDDHQTFDRYGVGEYLDQQMIAGRIPRAIVVSPKGDAGFWENWYDGSKNYRDWVTQDLLTDFSERYPHATCPDNCHLMGISMGGHGVFTMVAAEPNHFGTATVISGRLFTKSIETQKSTGNFLVRLLLPLKRIWGPEEQGRANAEVLYQRWLNDPVLAEKPLLFTWGREDSKDIIAFNTLFHKELAENDREHDLFVYDGAHKWVDWKGVIAESIRRQVQP